MDDLSEPRNASYVKKDDFTYVTVNSCFGIVSIFTNLIVLLAFYIKSTKTKHNKRIIHQYVISMAVADLTFGAVFVPLAVLSSIGLPYQREWCLLSIALQIMTVGFTIMALVATVEAQFISIIFPFFYQIRWTSDVANVHIVIHWLFGFLLGSPILLGYNVEDDTCYFLEIVPKNITLLVVFGMVFPSTVIMIVCYLAIYFTFIRIMSHRTTDLGILSGKHIILTKSSHLKTSAVIFLNVLLFLICWLPLYILDTINVFDSTFTANVHIINALLVLRCFRCAINPFLYAYHIPEVKTRFNDVHKWIRCCFCCFKGDSMSRCQSISSQTIVTKL
uniref:CSON011987 protein n=1 Tax=Culicoides sonorensis TaxID=179676 RepID=A0A336MGE1_CULSO